MYIRKLPLGHEKTPDGKPGVSLSQKPDQLISRQSASRHPSVL
jgi:hypothetical protein